MNKKLLIPILVILTFATSNIYATVDYLSVNPLTKQLYWAETGYSSGWIGWETIPEGLWKSAEQKYLEMGYTFTDNPFLVEEILSVIIGLIVLGLWIKKKKIKRRRMSYNNV